MNLYDFLKRWLNVPEESLESFDHDYAKLCEHPAQSSQEEKILARLDTLENTRSSYAIIERIEALEGNVKYLTKLHNDLGNCTLDKIEDLQPRVNSLESKDRDRTVQLQLIERTVSQRLTKIEESIARIAAKQVGLKILEEPQKCEHKFVQSPSSKDEVFCVKCGDVFPKEGLALDPEWSFYAKEMQKKTAKEPETLQHVIPTKDMYDNISKFELRNFTLKHRQINDYPVVCYSKEDVAKAKAEILKRIDSQTLEFNTDGRGTYEEQQKRKDAWREGFRRMKELSAQIVNEVLG